MPRILFSLAISWILLCTACRLPDRPSSVPDAGRTGDDERGFRAAAHTEDGELDARDEVVQPQTRDQADENAAPELPGAMAPASNQSGRAARERSLRLSPSLPDGQPYALPDATLVTDERGQAFQVPLKRESPALPYGVAVVASSSETGAGMFRRRLETAARLGPVVILLPPHVQVNTEGQFVLDDAAAGFGPADIEAPVALWSESDSDDGVECAVRIDSEAGTMLLLDSRSVDSVAEVRRSIDRLPGMPEVRESSIVLVTDRPLWTAAPALWAELASLPGMREQAVVLAFSRIGEVREEQRDGIRCVVVPHHVVRDEAGTVWISQGRGDPDVSRLHSDAISDIRRFNPRIQDERDRLVKSLIVTPVCGLRTETTVRFRNTLDTPLDVRADWTFGNEEVPVKPEILGFQLAPDEEFSQVFRFQNEDERPLKFLRPRFVLSMNAPDGAGGVSPLVVQAAPMCCMRGTVELVDDDVVLDGDPSEWAGRGYPLNHESQVVEGLDAWGGPADLSANLFVSRTSDSVLLGAHIYDDQLGKSDRDSRATLSIAVDLLPFQTLGSGIGTLSVPPTPTDQAPHSTTGLPPVLSASTEPDNNGEEHASGRPGRIELRFTKQTGIRITPKLEGVRARWSETAETLSFEARIPVDLFADGALGSHLRLDATLTEPSDDDRHVCLVFSGRDPELKNPELFGIFRVSIQEEDSE